MPSPLQLCVSQWAVLHQLPSEGNTLQLKYGACCVATGLLTCQMCQDL